MKYLNGNTVDYDFVADHINDRFSPVYFEGLQCIVLKKMCLNNAIIKDSSIIHEPSNYHLKEQVKKLNISIRMFKKVEDYNPDTTFNTMNYNKDVTNKRVYHA